MKPETMMIDEVKYVRADAVNQDVKGDLKIVILQRRVKELETIMHDHFGVTTDNCDKSAVVGACILEKSLSDHLSHYTKTIADMQKRIEALEPLTTKYPQLKKSPVIGFKSKQEI